MMTDDYKFFYNSIAKQGKRTKSKEKNQQK